MLRSDANHTLRARSDELTWPRFASAAPRCARLSDRLSGPGSSHTAGTPLARLAASAQILSWIPAIVRIGDRSRKAPSHQGPSLESDARWPVFVPGRVLETFQL